MEIVGRIETQLGRGVQQEGIAGGNNGQGNPGCPAVDRVLPLALRRDGIVASDGDARKAVGGTATAADLVLGIRERGAEQVVHRIARAAVGVFGACGQGHRGKGARGRVVHPIDRDGDGAGRHQMVAGAIGIAVIAIAGTGVVGVTRQRAGPRAGIALVVVGDGDVETAVPVGRRGIAHHIREGDSQRLETRIDLGLGGTSNGDGVRVQASDRSTHSPHGRDSARTHGDRDLHGAGAVVVGIVQNDVGIGTRQIQCGRAFGDDDIVGCDLSWIINGRYKQVAGVARDVVHGITGYRREVGIERIGRRHSRQVRLLVVGSTVSHRSGWVRKNAITQITQPVVGNHFDLVGGVYVGRAKVLELNRQAIEVSIDLVARTAHFHHAVLAVGGAIHRRAVTRGRRSELDAQTACGRVLRSCEWRCAVEQPHCDLNGAVAFAIRVAIVCIHVIDYEAGNGRGCRAGDGDVARARSHAGRVIDGGDGEGSADVCHHVGHAAAAHIAANGGGALAESERQRHITRIAAVLVVVGVERAGVVQTGGVVVCGVCKITPVEYRLDIGCAAGQGQGAGVLPADDDSLAARRGSAPRRAGVVYVQQALRHGHCDGHRRVERSGFRIGNHELVACVAYFAADIFVHREAGRAVEDGRLVDAGSAQIHRFGGNVAGQQRNRRSGFPVVNNGIDWSGGTARRCGLIHLAAVGVVACSNQRAAAVTQAVVHDDFELVERVGIVGEGHGEAGQCGIHLRLGALELQDVVVAVLRDHHARRSAVADLHPTTCKASRVISDRCAAAILQAYGDLQKVSGCGRVGQIGVVHAEACHRVVGCGGAVDGDGAGRRGQCRLVVGRGQRDEEDIVVRPSATVLEHTVVDYKVEFVVVSTQAVCGGGADFTAAVVV